MTQGNGTLRAAKGDSERLILNAMLAESGYSQFVVSREAWAASLRANAPLVEAVRRLRDTDGD